MSTGLGRFNSKRAKMRYLRKKADEHNQEIGYTDDYYETFDNFDPVVVKKKQPLFDPTQKVETLPYEVPGQVSCVPSALNLTPRSNQCTDH